jgi:D-glycero-alpha-D-manno-heptose-7-phosphate kinase
MHANKPSRIINAVAPIRVCDLGGWTDTWFAETGAVFNIAVDPFAEVQIRVNENGAGAPRVTLHAEDFGDRYVVDRQAPRYGKHSMLEACIDIMELPESMSFDIHLHSDAPAGCSTGTSASVSVALLAALDLLTPGRRSPHEIAALAHRVETEKLGLQCGIQDQLCAAYGGICFIEMFDYPRASVSQIDIPDVVRWELERRLLLVFLGEAHASSKVHGQVLERLDQPGADKSALVPLREAAYAGKDALFTGDLEGLGRCMIANTEAQASLHPALVSNDAKAIIELAQKYGALGWKVNGAGGNGGSLTILCGPDSAEKRAIVQELPAINPKYQVLPIHLAPGGLRRWES